jgi:hypothetical protein
MTTLSNNLPLYADSPKINGSGLNRCIMPVMLVRDIAWAVASMTESEPGVLS